MKPTFNVQSGLRLGGVVLCGGHSRRMRAPKEWLRVDGEYVLVRLARVLAEVAGRVVVAARAGQELPPLPDGVQIVCDVISNAGPLAGLAAGMEALARDCDAVIVTPCDHPWISADFLRRLVAELGDAPAVVPKHGDRLFALLGVYRMSVLPMLRESLTRGDFRAAGFAQACGARVLDADALRAVDPELTSMRNINAPGDWTPHSQHKPAE